MAKSAAESLREGRIVLDNGVLLSFPGMTKQWFLKNSPGPLRSLDKREDWGRYVTLALEIAGSPIFCVVYFHQGTVIEVNLTVTTADSLGHSSYDIREIYSDCSTWFAKVFGSLARIDSHWGSIIQIAPDGGGYILLRYSTPDQPKEPEGVTDGRRL
jgi:hypothetical protein